MLTAGSLINEHNFMIIITYNVRAIPPTDAHN